MEKECLIAPIGLGTYKTTEDLTGGKTRQIVREALEVGYRYIDTAAFYRNEREIGEVLAENPVDRSELFIATKVWKTELGYEKTRASVRASLERLGIDYADLVLIHWPKETPEDENWKEKVQGSYKALEDLCDEGKIRFIGLSNFLPHHVMAVMEIARIRPVVDQLELHAGHMQYAAVDYLKKMGIKVQAWSPLGRQRLFRHPSIVKLAEKYGVTVSDLLLRFLLQQDIAVVPKATTKEHLTANLHPAEIVISEEDMYFLLCLPSVGWAGEHPDFERAPVDFRYSL